jgi:hypothetical protein
MQLLSRFAPPAQLDDLGEVPEGHAQWHAFISETLDDAVAELGVRNLVDAAGRRVPPQFFNPARFLTQQPLRQLPIRWNAFPRSLLLRHGRDKAMVLADMLWPSDADDEHDPLEPVWPQRTGSPSTWMRPQDEYCEWRVERDGCSGRICRIVFTAEPPETWMALHGGAMPQLRTSSLPPRPLFQFRGDPRCAARRYSALLGCDVQPGDLIDARGRYDPRNRWNTTHGIVHLTHTVNTLCAAVALAADGTLGFRHPSSAGPITLPEALCASQANGDPNNHSDPTIVGTVQALARGGAWITLADPVGLAMEEVDTNGWDFPGMADVRQLLHIARGRPGDILRLVVQAPANSPHLLDRLTIAGEPLLHGGQIAECITMKLTAACTEAGATTPAAPITPARQALLRNADRRLVRTKRYTDPIVRAGLVSAFAAPAPIPSGPGRHHDE